MAPVKKRTVKKKVEELAEVNKILKNPDDGSVPVNEYKEEAIEDVVSEDEIPLARLRPRRGQKPKIEKLIEDSEECLKITDKTFLIPNENEPASSEISGAINKQMPVLNEIKAPTSTTLTSDIEAEIISDINEVKKGGKKKKNIEDNAEYLCEKLNEMQITTVKINSKSNKKTVKSKKQNEDIMIKPLSKASKNKVKNDKNEENEVEENDDPEMTSVNHTNEKLTACLKRGRRNQNYAPVSSHMIETVSSSVNTIINEETKPLKRGKKNATVEDNTAPLPVSADNPSVDQEIISTKGKRKKPDLKEKTTSSENLSNGSNEEQNNFSAVQGEGQSIQLEEKKQSKTLIPVTKKQLTKSANTVTTKKNQKNVSKKSPRENGILYQLVSQALVSGKSKSRTLKKFPSEDNLRNIAVRKVTSKSEENLEALNLDIIPSVRPKRAAATKNSHKDINSDANDDKEKKFVKRKQVK